MQPISIDSNGQTDPIVIRGGDHLLSIRATPGSPAGTFGGGTVTFQWREKSTHEWITLQEDGSEKSVTTDYSDIVRLPGGQFAVTLTGAVSPDLELKFELIPA